MRKLIIITWVALLLIKQGIMVGGEQKQFTTTICGTKIVVKQGDITQEEGVAAIVNAANFDLVHDDGVAKALKEADPRWDNICKEKIKNFKKNGFKDGGMRAVVTPAFALNGIQYIVNAVGSDGNYPGWEDQLKKTYLDTLTVSKECDIKSISFPPISTGLFAKDAEEKVVITLDKAAKIAISATREFLQKNRQSFREIRFTSIEKVPEHFFAYKNALKKPFNFLILLPPAILIFLVLLPIIIKCLNQS